MTDLIEREAAAKECDRIAGNTADFTRDYRRAAGHCATLIRALPAAQPAVPQDVAVMVDALRIKSNMINMGERIAWGSETGLMDEAAAMLTSLSAALSASQAEVARVTGELNARTFTVDEGAEWKARAEVAEAEVARLNHVLAAAEIELTAGLTALRADLEAAERALADARAAGIRLCDRLDDENDHGRKPRRSIAVRYAMNQLRALLPADGGTNG